MLARVTGIVLVALSCLVGSSRLPAIQIQFDYRFDSVGLFNDPAARSTLAAAADVFDVLLDDLSAISPFGINSWSARLFNPGNGANVTLDNLNVPANTLTIFVGGRNLSGETLGIGGPGGFEASGTQNWLNNVFGRGEGLQADVMGAGAHEFGPWGGSISFDTLLPNGQARTWHLDPTTDPARNTTDMFSVAVHEIGHVLGFGTTDSFTNDVVSGHFEGPQAKAINNGQRIRMHTDNAHWASETRSPPWDENAPIASMDPTITTVNGFMRRRHFTALDFAALDDLGWDVDPSVYVVTPEPIPGDYNGSGSVEQGDLDLVLLNWGRQAMTVPPAWVNDLPTGLVDQGELDGVLLNWGNAASSGSARSAATPGTVGVPEPASRLLFVALVIVLALGKSSRGIRLSARGR